MKVRSRSRFSPANKLESLDDSLSRSTTNLKPRSGFVKPQAKTRYHVPSSAKSLPSLAFTEAQEKKKSDRKQGAVTSAPNRKKIAPEPTLKTNEKVKAKSSVPAVEKIEREESLAEDKTKERVEEKCKKPTKTFEKYIEDCAKKDSEKEQLPGKKENSESLSVSEKKVPCDEISNGPNANEKVPNESDKNTKNILMDQEVVDDEDNQFDEEIKRNTEAEELLQKEINELESADLEVSRKIGCPLSVSCCCINNRK